MSVVGCVVLEEENTQKSSRGLARSATKVQKPIVWRKAWTEWIRISSKCCSENCQKNLDALNHVGSQSQARFMLPTRPNQKENHTKKTRKSIKSLPCPFRQRGRRRRKVGKQYERKRTTVCVLVKSDSVRAVQYWKWKRLRRTSWLTPDDKIMQDTAPRV